jgi:hypothetical protein
MASTIRLGGGGGEGAAGAAEAPPLALAPVFVAGFKRRRGSTVTASALLMSWTMRESASSASLFVLPSALDAAPTEETRVPITLPERLRGADALRRSGAT